MRYYETEVTAGPDGGVRLTNVPFPPGTRVRVMVVGIDASATADPPSETEVTYPLRGKPYWAAPDAFDGPAIDPGDWEANRDGA